MSRYATVQTSIFDDKKFRELPEQARMLFIYLLTCKHSNLPGIFVMPKSYIARDLQWGFETVSKQLRNCSDTGFLAYDEGNETVWVKNWLRHKPLKNDNMVKGAVVALAEVPYTHLFKRFYEYLQSEKPNGFETISKPLRNRFDTVSNKEEVEVEVEVKEEVVKPFVAHPENQDARRLAELLFSLIAERDPKAKKPNFRKWADEMDRLIRMDKRTPEEIEKLIHWVQADSFWKNNILSPKKLREKYTQLVLKMSSNNGGRSRYDENMQVAKKFMLKTKEAKNGEQGVGGKSLDANVRDFPGQKDF